MNPKEKNQVRPLVFRMLFCNILMMALMMSLFTIDYGFSVLNELPQVFVVMIGVGMKLSAPKIPYYHIFIIMTLMFLCGSLVKEVTYSIHPLALFSIDLLLKFFIVAIGIVYWVRKRYIPSFHELLD